MIPYEAPRYNRDEGFRDETLKLTGMHARSRVAAWVGLACFSAVTASGQTPDPLEPDRPDITNGPHIVDVGLVQLEIGCLFSRLGADHRMLGTPAIFRLGLTDWFEMRVGGDGFVAMRDHDRRESGVGNVQVGAKLRLWSDSGGLPVLSILPAVNLPAASAGKGLGSGQADFTVAVLTGVDFLTRGHIDVNYGVGRIGAGSGLPRFTQQLVSLSTSAEVPGPVTPYVEAFWISQQDFGGGRVAAIDAGAIYVISPRFALDGGVQSGLTAAAPSVSIFGGLSLVLGNVLGEHGGHARQRQSARRATARAVKAGR